MRITALLFVCLQIFINMENFVQCFEYVPSNMHAYYGLGPSYYKPRDYDVFNRQFKMENFNLPPPSISISADGLIINGAISVSGTLPFLSSVTVQGELPMTGSGVVEFSTGNNEVAITRELPGYANRYGSMSFY
ncbi:unnamed protein product [Pieris macdunnoughi]|nr:unnamed protein product [Pieris macdunnoughi]